MSRPESTRDATFTVRLLKYDFIDGLGIECVEEIRRPVESLDPYRVYCALYGTPIRDKQEAADRISELSAHDGGRVDLDSSWTAEVSRG